MLWIWAWCEEGKVMIQFPAVHQATSERAQGVAC
jgi:hypothetical protein